MVNTASIILCSPLVHETLLNHYYTEKNVNISLTFDYTCITSNILFTQNGFQFISSHLASLSIFHSPVPQSDPAHPGAHVQTSGEVHVPPF